MPSIQKLQITAFRNISQGLLEPAPRLNLVSGANGSGKSSILEAIHYLGLGRSFRNIQQIPLIQYGKRDCAVHGDLENNVSIGISRSLDSPPVLKIQGKKADSAAELAKLLPLQLLNAEAFKLLEGGPKARRQFIDWGVFHVEHGFHSHWREYRRCLQNRNILLKKRAGETELAPWTLELVRHAGEIDRQRADCLARYMPVLEALQTNLLPVEGIKFRYYRGWNEDDDLGAVLETTLERDLALGHTTAGPHRADLKIRVGTQHASDILSRGQQKLLVSAMKLAQGSFLASESGRQCVYLIDDLPAELDSENRQKVCLLLKELGGQVFITGAEQDELLGTVEKSGFEANESKLFHVKHGKISALGPALE